jgi:hypothetical protein
MDIEAENLFPDNFNIEETMEMGDTRLLNDLLSPETSTGDPEKIEKIVKEIEQPVEKKTSSAKIKTIPSPTEETTVDEKQNMLSSLFDEGEEEEEEGEEKEKIEKEKSKENPTIEEEPVENQFAALSKDLFNLGVFSKDEDEEDVAINTPQEFLDRFNGEKKKGAIEIVNNFIGQFGQDYQNAFDAIFVKGINPKEYFGIYNNVVSFAELDLAQEDNQVKVMKQALSDQGFEAEDIDSEIERIKNYGDLEAVSTKHHKVLVKKETLRLKEKEQEAERELQQKTIIKNQFIENVQQVLQEKLKTKEFDGIPLNPKLATELQDFLLVDKYRTVSGETLTDFDKTILEL